jgi:hypothetical protein
VQADERERERGRKKEEENEVAEKPRSQFSCFPSSMVVKFAKREGARERCRQREREREREEGRN